MDLLAELAEFARYEGLTVIYAPLRLYDAVIKGKKIILADAIKGTEAETRILAHEIGHYLAHHKGDLITKEDPQAEAEADRYGELVIASFTE